jgi:hypothetical protein
VYKPRDLRSFYLIRHLAALRISRAGYRDLFGSDPLDDFRREFDAVAREELITVTDEAIEPSDLGMFYADSIAAVLVWKQHAQENNAPRADLRRRERRQTRGNDNGYGHM